MARNAYSRLVQYETGRGTANPTTWNATAKAPSPAQARPWYQAAPTGERAAWLGLADEPYRGLLLGAKSSRLLTVAAAVATGELRTSACPRRRPLSRCPLPSNPSHREGADLRWLGFSGKSFERCGRPAANRSEPFWLRSAVRRLLVPSDEAVARGNLRPLKDACPRRGAQFGAYDYPVLVWRTTRGCPRRL